MLKTAVVAAALVAELIAGQARATVPYPEWWFTTSGPGSKVAKGGFTPCERVGPSAPGVDPDPGRSMAANLAQAPNVSAAEFSEFTVHTFGSEGDVEFVKVTYTNAHDAEIPGAIEHGGTLPGVNWFVYTQTQEACEAVRAKKLSWDILAHQNAGEGKIEQPVQPK